ncbi:histidinol-phosphate transaminase [bacterium]|nr:histidinol-phosphate transaminase [bacterium]
MATRPEPVPQLARVTPYAPGASPKPGSGPSYKLASNENPLGCSPRAKAAFLAAGEKLERYPDGGAVALRAAIAARFGLDPARIICGAGSDEIFQMIARAYLAPGVETIVTAHAFSIYAILADQCGAKVVVAPETELTASVDAILERVTPSTRVVWLANPNNPTGTYIPHDEVKRLHAGLPANVLLVLDGAYAEFVRRNDYSGGFELAGEHENVLVTRTFSKLHGLAGVRIGWGYAPAHVIDALERVRMPFNANAPGQAAAIAALQDDDFIERSLAHNDAELARLTTGLRELGLETPESFCNFVIARFPQTPGRTAAEAFAFLMERGVTVRGMKGYGLPDHLRISVGTREGDDALLAGLKTFFSK